MTTVAIIPARGSSKQLPRKNLRQLDGRPMIVHTVEAARAARVVDRVVVSTDDERIAAVAGAAGAEVPFLRPAALATDEARTVDAVIHAVDMLEIGGASVDEVVVLQPTSPFRTGAMIDAAVDLMRRVGADSAVSVAPLGLPISVVGSRDADGLFRQLAIVGDVRRQAAPPAVRLTGGIYVTTREVLRSGRLLGDRVASVVLDGPASMDIDDEADLRRARRVAARRATGGAS